jgi:hypothetical protein
MANSLNKSKISCEMSLLYTENNSVYEINTQILWKIKTITFLHRKLKNKIIFITYTNQQ